MNELFREEYTEACEKLYNKGFIVCNMVYDNTLYEVYKEEEVMIDNLSLAQLQQLANML